MKTFATVLLCLTSLHSLCEAVPFQTNLPQNLRETRDAFVIPMPAASAKVFGKNLHALRQAKWLASYDTVRHIFLAVRDGRARFSTRAAQEIESALKKIAPGAERKRVWAWSNGDSSRYFPTGEILVLFKNTLTDDDVRKRISEVVPKASIRFDGSFLMEPKPVRKEAASRGAVPGFSEKDAPQALEALARLCYDATQTYEPKQLRIPIARLTLSQGQERKAFAYATRIAAIPGVHAATADFHLLSKRTLSAHTQHPLPQLTDESIHHHALLDLALPLLDPADLSAAPGRFLASRERVAVIDYTFRSHPDLDLDDLMGFDAADGDNSPLTPISEVDSTPHGLWMCGIIGGSAQALIDRIGIASGSVLVPVRPSWTKPDDFVMVNGDMAFADYDEFSERYASTWVDAIKQLFLVSFTGVETANLSISVNRSLWNEAHLSPWLTWWLTTGAHGLGVFASASAGNDPSQTDRIALPASEEGVFAVGIGKLRDGTMLGNSGPGLQIVVDDGCWPMYKEDGTVQSVDHGGSSAASAVSAGTVSIIRSINPDLTAEEIREILRRTTRKAPGQSALEDDEGYTTKFGWGFLNAYAAIDVAWRGRRTPGEILNLGVGSRPLTQIRLGEGSCFAGKRSGTFWSLHQPSGALGEQRYIHDRDQSLRHVDQAIDTWGLPFGEITVFGQFGKDAYEEVALQLDAETFWPTFAPEAAHSFLVYRYDRDQRSWVPFGGRSPYATGLASPQIVFPTTRPINGVATLGSGGGMPFGDRLVAWQRELINIVEYDAASGVFVRLNPVDFAPPILSSAIDSAISGRITDKRILKLVRLSQAKLLALGEFTVLLPGVYDPPSPPRPPVLRTYVTAFILSYDRSSSKWSLVPLSSNPNDTHVLVGERGSFAALSDTPEVFAQDFGGTVNPAHVKVVVHMGKGRLVYITFCREAADQPFSGYTKYDQELKMPGRISRLQAGRFGVGSSPRQIAWLTDLANGNCVHFAEWAEQFQEWRILGVQLYHGRKDNEATDLAIVRAGTAEVEVPALLMKKPMGNVYLTFQWYSGMNRFLSTGQF
jgi:hypothetical protein